MSKKLLFNSLSSTALFVVNIGVAFFLTPILLKALGNIAYGFWELVMSVVGYMGLLDLGIGSAVVRYVSVADGSQDREELRKVISTSFVFFAAIGIVAFILFSIFGTFPEILVGKAVYDIKDISAIFYIFAFNAVFLFPMQILVAVLLGLQYHYLINFTRITAVLLKAFIIYYYIISYSEGYLLAITLVELGYTLISFLIFFLFVFFIKKIPNIAIHDVNRKKFKDLFIFGSKNLVMMTASRLQNLSVPIIIANIIGVGSVVYYVLPNRLISYAKGFSLAVGYPLTPYFGVAVGKGQADELRRSWLTTTFVLQTIMFILPVVLFYYGGTFLSLWIGEEYAVAGYWVLRILIIGLIADTFAVNAFRILTAQGNHGRSASIWLVLAVISIPLGIIGGKLWGVTGITLGVTLAAVVGNLVTVLFACSSVQISLIEYLKKTFFKLLLPLVLVNGISAVLVFFCPIVNFFFFVVQVGTIVMSYFVFVWIFSIEKTLKNKIICNARSQFTSKK